MPLRGPGVKVVQLLGSQGFWQHQGLLGGGGQGSRKYSSRRVWQPVLANILQYSCLENPLPDRAAWKATVYRVQRVRHY